MLISETPGAWVADKKQKCALLQILSRHEHTGIRERLHHAMTQCRDVSRTTCEGCGVTVPSVDPNRAAAWRRHCVAFKSFSTDDGGRTERELWEARAGRTWPPFDAW